MTGAITTVADDLARMAREHGDLIALHLPKGKVAPTGESTHEAWTFAGLNARVDALAQGLTAAGVTPGMRVAVMVPPSIDFFALTFALLRMTAIPVLIDPGMGVKNLGRCLAEAEPTAFIGVPKAHFARRLFGWARSSVSITVNVGSRGRFFCHHSLEELRRRGEALGPFAPPPVQSSTPAAILFTSGSTGIAKGALYTHGIFAAQVQLLKATYGIVPGEVDLCTFPLFALFGPALGMSCVVPQMDFTRPATVDPRTIIAQVKQFRVTNLFGSPAVIRRLGDWAAATQSGPLTSLKRVISAGAPASVPALERFARLLPPGVEIFTPYGATEALPVANIGSAEILGETRRQTEAGEGVCVGRPVPGIEVTVIPIRDDAIPTWDPSQVMPAGTIGEFVIRGPVVTKEYFRRPEATRLAKISDPATGAILHRMGDVGYLDASGRLWFCGRKSHRVETAGGPLYTDQVEPVLNQVPGVRRTALVGITRQGKAMPVICVELDGSRPEREVIADLHRRMAEHPLTRRISQVLRYPRAFPVDVRHNSKIFREKLAIWADRILPANLSEGARP